MGFARIESSQSEFSNGFLTGKELDPDFVDFNSVNRRYHFPARFLLPYRASFAQLDPLSVPFRWNKYSYVRGRPLSYVDRFGLQDEDDLGEAEALWKMAAEKARFEQRLLGDLTGKLQSLCDDDTCLSCKCSHEKCYAEAAQVAQLYFDVWKKNVRVWTILDVRGGRKCYTWRNLVWGALWNFPGECFKVAVSGHLKPSGSGYEFAHNFVTVTVGEQSAIRGVCTLTLDPWLEELPKAYTDAEHDYTPSGRGKGPVPHNYQACSGKLGGITGSTVDDPYSGHGLPIGHGIEPPDNPVPHPPPPPPSERYKNWPPKHPSWDAPYSPWVYPGH